MTVSYLPCLTSKINVRKYTENSTSLEERPAKDEVGFLKVTRKGVYIYIHLRKGIKQTISYNGIFRITRS